MKRINFLLIAFSLFIFSSCEQEDYEFGDILSPTNLTISASLQGADADNPYGDGSGYVTFTATAADAITCLLYTSPSPRDRSVSRMPSSA